MKIGIYGGSFNPIHNAHVEIVKFILEQLKLDKIIVIPVGKASHRDDVMVSGKFRKKMCELAFENEEKVFISDIEIKSQNISYTIDTLKKLISLYGEDNEFYEIVGEDSAYNFSKWKDYNQILELSKVVVFQREGYNGGVEHKNVIYLDTPLYNISSTMVRNQIKNNEDISKIVPKKVAQFIQEKKLYTVNK